MSARGCQAGGGARSSRWRGAKGTPPPWVSPPPLRSAQKVEDMRGGEPALQGGAKGVRWEIVFPQPASIRGGPCRGRPRRAPTIIASRSVRPNPLARHSRMLVAGIQESHSPSAPLPLTNAGSPNPLVRHSRVLVAGIQVIERFRNTELPLRVPVLFPSYIETREVTPTSWVPAFAGTTFLTSSSSASQHVRHSRWPSAAHG